VEEKFGCPGVPMPPGTETLRVTLKTLASALSGSGSLDMQRGRPVSPGTWSPTMR